MQRKVIGSYPICNNVGLAVYEIDESNDRVLVGFNNNPPRWYKIREACYMGTGKC